MLPWPKGITEAKPRLAVEVPTVADGGANRVLPAAWGALPAGDASTVADGVIPRQDSNRAFSELRCALAAFGPSASLAGTAAAWFGVEAGSTAWVAPAGPMVGEVRFMQGLVDVSLVGVIRY